VQKTGFLLLAFAAGCIDQRSSPTEGLVTTLELQLLAPQAGSPEAPNTVREATFNLLAKGDDGGPYPGDATVDIYISYGGVRTGTEVQCGAKSDAPIESLTVRGRLDNHEITLPVAYGTTALWAVERGSHVVGASQPIYFPNPTIPNIQTPPDEAAPNATFCTNFEKKFVRVDHATGSGELLVDSVFGNAITITDTGATDYRSLYLFTFGRPSSRLVPGRRVHFFTGNISKFIGFTEVNFPCIEADLESEPDPSKLPPPIPLTVAERSSGSPKLLKAVSSVVEVTGKICPIPTSNPNNDELVQREIDSWVKFNTFNIGTLVCDSFNTYSVQLPAKKVGTFDPTVMAGQDVTVRGMLKNSSGQNSQLTDDGFTISCNADSDCPLSSNTCINNICKRGPFNFWTITARGSEDLPQ